MSTKNNNLPMSFIAKDDGKEKRISKWIQGKHGMIGIIRPCKPSTEKDKQEFLNSLAKVAIKNAEKQMLQELENQNEQKKD